MVESAFTHLAVVGSRNYPNMAQVSKVLWQLPPRLVVVTGSATGVDAMARGTAITRGMEYRAVGPRPEVVAQRGIKAALLDRNQDIVEASQGMLAFWDGVSKGTADAIEKARRKAIPVVIVHPRSDQAEVVDMVRAMLAGELRSSLF